MISILLPASSRNTSATKLIVNTRIVRFASAAFRELLTCTQTLKTMSVVEYVRNEEILDEVDICAITSGFANNATLRGLKFQGWRAADLAPVLTALQNHPVLRKIHLVGSLDMNLLLSLSALEVLLRSHNSKIKELVLEPINTSNVGLYKVMRELGCNTTDTNLAIRDSSLSCENVQQLKAVLRQNTALESLDLRSSALGSAGLVEIIPVLYRNTSINALDLTNNDLDNIESVNVLRELIRRNKTITSLCIDRNTFGRNAAAVRSIADGVRSHTTLQQLDLSTCELDDQDISVLANALAIRNASPLELHLRTASLS
jgi:hypothetical protein